MFQKAKGRMLISIVTCFVVFNVYYLYLKGSVHERIMPCVHFSIIMQRKNFNSVTNTINFVDVVIFSVILFYFIERNNNITKQLDISLA